MQLKSTRIRNSDKQDSQVKPHTTRPISVYYSRSDNLLLVTLYAFTNTFELKLRGIKTVLVYDICDIVC